MYVKICLACSLILVMSCGKTNFTSVTPAVVAENPTKNSDDLKKEEIPGSDAVLDSRQSQETVILNPDKPTLDPKDYVTRDSVKLSINWHAPTNLDVPVDFYSLKLLDETDQEIFIEKIPASESNKLSYTFVKSFAEGRYTIIIQAHDSDGIPSDEEIGSLIIDKTPPQLSLLLGLEKVAEPCKLGLKGRGNVAIRLVPFDFCAQDLGVASSGIDKVCIKHIVTAADAEQPKIDAACWKSPNDILRLILLSNGSNKVAAWAMDGVGNIGATDSGIDLNIGKPPAIDILRPNTSLISSKLWTAGDKIDFKWKIEDDDTAYQDIKIIVSVVDAKDSSKFVHLGCNFANSPLWTQCPQRELEESAEFFLESDAGTGGFHLVIPSQFSATSQFILLITAIDKSGNAAVASTQEINSGFEVLAGRTYKGLGGSGVVIDENYSDTYLATDNTGILYVSQRNYKIHPFDYRTCKLSRKEKDSPSSFDCPDILVTDYNINGAIWTYSRSENVFYTVSDSDDGKVRYILRIDFTRRTVEPILGGAGKADLSPNVIGSTANTFSGNDISSYLFYDEQEKLLVFRTASAFYSINAKNELHYILGGSADVNLPTAKQISATQKDLLLPKGSSPFAISKDKKIFFSGDKPDYVTNGSGYAIHYLISGFSYTDPEKQVNLVTTGSCSAAGCNTGVFKDIKYDDVHNRFLLTQAWWGIYDIPVPAGNDPAITLTYNRYVGGGGSNLYEKDYIASNENNKLPAFYKYWSGYLAVPSSDFLYFTNPLSGSICSLDIASGKIERIIGAFAGSDPIQGQLAINRRLDTPRYLELDEATGTLYFNDYFNLQSININEIAQENAQIKTLVSDFSRYPFKIAKGNLYSITKGTAGLEVRPLNDLSAQKQITLNTTTGTKPIYQYDVNFGFNASDDIKTAFLTSLYENKTGKVFKKALFFNDLNSLKDKNFNDIATTPLNSSERLNIQDLYTTGMANCGTGTETCAQGNLVDNKYIPGESFRFAPYSGLHLTWRSRIGKLAFSSDNKSIFGCFNTKFMMVEISSTPKFFSYTPSIADLKCNDNTGIYRNVKGSIYYTTGNKIYLINTSAIIASGTAVITEVPTVTPLYSGAIGDFTIDKEYVYYTDTQSHRVFRSKLIK